MKFLILLNIIAIIFTRRVMHKEERCITIVKDNNLPGFTISIDKKTTKKKVDGNTTLCSKQETWKFKLDNLSILFRSKDYLIECYVGPKYHFGCKSQGEVSLKIAADNRLTLSKP